MKKLTDIDSKMFTRLFRKSKIVHVLLLCVIFSLLVHLELRVGLEHREYLSGRDFHQYLPYLSHDHKVGSSLSLRDDMPFLRGFNTTNTTMRVSASDIKGEWDALNPPSVSEILDHARLKNKLSASGKQENGVDRNVSRGTAQLIMGQSEKRAKYDRVLDLASRGSLEAATPGGVVEPANNGPLEKAPPVGVMEPPSNGPLQAAPAGGVDKVAVPGVAAREWKPPLDAGMLQQYSDAGGSVRV